MRTITLSFSQSRSPDGTSNSIDLELHGISYEANRLQFGFVHVDSDDVPEPVALDGYLFGFIFFAMQHADRLVVRGPLTAVALRNVQTFMEAWVAWRGDRYNVVEIEPDEAISDEACQRVSPSRNGRSIAAFSGGVDSCFTLLRHRQTLGWRSRYRVTDALAVHGFDIPEPDRQAFRALVDRTDPLLRSLGIRRRVVRTDVRRRALREWEHQPWEHSFGAQLAGVLHQFSHEFEYGLIGSGEPYQQPQVAWGSLPSTDPLLSGAFLGVVHDGAGYSRTHKVEELATNELASRVVKVCWEGADGARNCGRCEKCIRTRLNFMAVGIDVPGCFDEPFELGMIGELSVRNSIQIDELQSIVDFALARGTTPDWVDALRVRIDELRAGLPA